MDQIEIVEDQFFATVLNRKGEFQVGDIIYKITRNHVYRVLESSSDQLENIFLRDNGEIIYSQKKNVSPEVEVFEIERIPMMNNTALASKKKRECSSNFSKRRRIKG